MAAKKNIRVGGKVTFTDRDGKTKSATVIKTNPKTARVKVARCGEFLISYSLLKVAGTKKAVPRKRALTRAAKKICAVPKSGPRKLKGNPPSAKKLLQGIKVITPSWAKKQKTAQLDSLGQGLMDWLHGEGTPLSATQLERVNKKLTILLDELETRDDWRMGGGKKLNPAAKKRKPSTYRPGPRTRFRISPQETRKRRAELLGIDTSRPGWSKEYSRQIRKHTIRRRHLASQPRGSGSTHALSTLGYDIDGALERASGVTATPKKNPSGWDPGWYLIYYSTPKSRGGSMDEAYGPFATKGEATARMGSDDPAHYSVERMGDEENPAPAKLKLKLTGKGRRMYDAFSAKGVRRFNTLERKFSKRVSEMRFNSVEDALFKVHEEARRDPSLLGGKKKLNPPRRRRGFR